MNMLIIVLCVLAMCFFSSLDVFAKDDKAVVHAHILHTYNFNKQDFSCDDLEVSGYMVGHSHGLPTNPVVTDFSEEQCLIKGLMFNMPGSWKIKISRDNETVRILSFDVL
ncbi:hypothetical protein L1D15_21765 [Vibrio sp. Isolate25]|uniref:hypothetical protein n=1 Tax=Vibrio sp. Isolate25 TaxID=2908535 RepID=UPI001EFCE386|nr:hypothetical protein [Vibrio sp. Isolate25]MCG9599317.1 hypothetical protein [Vibrio sp. Isolate25]